MKRLFIILFALQTVFATAQNLSDFQTSQTAMTDNPASLLLGRLSGVRVSATDGGVNSALNTVIRGFNTVRGDSQPLWIIDGVIMNNSLNQDLDPFWQYPETVYAVPVNTMAYLSADEIESIEVLKDISATAIYGNNGANGVIIITTKKGSREGVNYDWHSNLGLGLPSESSPLFGPGISHSHSLSISGSDNQTSYNVSAFYRDIDGVAERNGNNVGGLTVALSTQANPIIWFGLNSNLSVGKFSNVASTGFLGQPTAMVLAREPGVFTYDTLKGWMAGYDDDITDYRAVNSIYLTVNFAKSLALKLSGGADFDSNNRAIWLGPKTSFGKENTGAASSINSMLVSYNGSAVLDFNRFFGNDHKVELKLGAELLGNVNKFNTMNGTQFFNTTRRARGLSLAGSKPMPRKFTRNYLHAGAFFSAKYDFKDLAGADALIRADQTKKYDDWSPVLYPAVNVWADLGKIFGIEGDIFTSARLSAGYGAAGREYYVPYELTGNYLRGDYPEVPAGAEAFFDGVYRLRSSEYNVGLSLGFLKDRLRLDAKYYDKITRDEFSMYCFGISGERLWNWWDRSDVFSRNDKVANRGFEFDLSYEPIRKKKLGLVLNANATYNVNQVTDIHASDMRGLFIGGGAFANVNVLGRQVGEIFGYVDSEGGYKDITNDGRVTEVDRVMLGNTMPKFFYGFGVDFRWQRYKFNLQADGAGGFYVANLNRMLADGKADISSDYVEKADFFRINSLSVSYDIPLKQLGIRFFKEASAALTARNLLTVSPYSGWNPDVNSFGSTVLSAGIDYGSYPVARSIIFTISAKF